MASSTQSPGKCPVCGEPTVQAYRPFCSRRCADIDLGRWLRGTYAIPDRAESEDGDEAAATDGAGTSDGNPRKD